MVRFHTTQWSAVLDAAHRTSPEGEKALAGLCQVYWYPLYAYIRRQGAPQADAQDLTQQFFVHVLSTDLLACHRYANGLAAAAAVPCRTLVVIGARDIMAPPRNAQALCAALADVEVVTFPETGHALMAERPGDVLDALRRFL